MKHTGHIPQIKGISLLMVMLVTVIISFRLNTPPPVVYSDAPDKVFSAERAFEHLLYIASQKNPVGSAANEDVRHYIMKQIELMGFEPQLQLAGFYDPRLQRAATLGNVMTRISGTGSGRAILFTGHYDTVGDAYGASDNGAAVAAMLELIRLLKHHPPPENDLIFLFTDAEEIGLLGAKAFLQQHPWAEDIYAVINLEARGTKGQSIMFETGYNNLNMIGEFAMAAPYPAANSLSYELYRRMRFGTDFCAFKHRGYQGLNFAYIENEFDYHTAGDNIENTDLRSVQHHGSYIKSLALHLGNITADLYSEQNAVYFNTIGYGFAYYPYSMVLPVAILISLIFAVVLFAGFKNGFLNIKQLLSGFIGFLIHLLILYVFVDVLYNIISQYYPGNNFRLLEYNRQTLLTGFAGLAAALSFGFFSIAGRGIKLWQLAAAFITVIFLMIWSGQISFFNTIIAAAICLILFFLFRKPISVWNLSAGALAVWAILMILVSLLSAGSSFLFTWPLLFSLIPPGIVFLSNNRKKDSLLHVFLLFLFAVPVLLWYPVFTNIISTAMGIWASAITIIIIGLMMGLLIPHTDIITRQKPWAVPAVALACGLFFILKGSVNLEYDQRYRKQNNIIYATSGLTGKTLWLTLDPKPDEWTKQFLTTSPRTFNMTEIFPTIANEYPAAVAKTQPLPAPSCRLLSDTISDNKRILKLHLKTERNLKTVQNAHWMTAYFNAGNSDISISLDYTAKHPLRPTGEDNWHILRYFAPPKEGIFLTIYIEPEEKLTVHLNDFVDGLPDFIQYVKRPDYMMPRGDMSVVSMRFVF